MKDQVDPFKHSGCYRYNVISNICQLFSQSVSQLVNVKRRSLCSQVVSVTKRTPQFNLAAFNSRHLTCGSILPSIFLQKSVLRGRRLPLLMKLGRARLLPSTAAGWLWLHVPHDVTQDRYGFELRRGREKKQLKQLFNICILNCFMFLVLGDTGICFSRNLNANPTTTFYNTSCD